MFGASRTLPGAQEFYSDVKGRMAAFRRNPNSPKIMSGLSVSDAPTHEEAVSKYDELEDLIVPKTRLDLLTERLNYDLTDCDVDGYLPNIAGEEIEGSRAELIIELAIHENLINREFYRHFAGASGHCHITGSTKEVTDMMEEWEGGLRNSHVAPFD